ncbi:DUF4846 domain-containing protein [Pseudoflavitalea sp. G-6-1-2]|uniref:DUF4846 domain-containing protein n=1 Tax=Pseudoflavitalea sp. G-6-1-2 TaxID=2728841 RepID=UPI00146EA29B|nr:DUF4846 domain-containing protein [Pseudoflavitalea sp. G-6-1-2]NML21554.1 DUF4846 domain-containing protein [Pseudoflavitalea sp. G-6-1-2]
MKRMLFSLSIILPVLGGCQPVNSNQQQKNVTNPQKPVLTKVSDIPPPPGCNRFDGTDAGFAGWLRNIPLKKDNTVYLYDGRLKANQQAQFAVLDVPVGTRDLQQCADAVMRLRASWLYDKGEYASIKFADNNGRMYTCPPSPDSLQFEKYLQTVYSYCGTISLSRQLESVYFDNMQPGDVLIQGGSPGHAVIVMDVAIEPRTSKKYYMLAQSYMPAQNIHILKNPSDADLSPWYSASEANSLISTPEWRFYKKDLKRW